MNNVKCLGCQIEGPKDDWLLEDGEMPVCDECVYAMCEVTVEYDGSLDLVEHLQSELKNSRCPHCYEKTKELDWIRYGAPTGAFMKCGNCGTTHIFDVHIEFV